MTVAKTLPIPETGEVAAEGEALRLELNAWILKFEAFLYMSSQKALRHELGKVELADVGLLLREFSKEGTHIRKESNKHVDVAEEQLGQIVIDECINDVEAEMAIRASLGTASARMAVVAQVPATKSEEYRELMREVGVPDALAQNGGLALHYVNFKAHIDALSEAGESIPHSLRTITRPACTFRRYRTTEKK